MSKTNNALDKFMYLKEISAENDRLRKAIKSVLTSMNWYQTTFKGPEHEFEHAWRVEWPYELEEALNDTGEDADK